jgi:hypothetical protein
VLFVTDWEPERKPDAETVPLPPPEQWMVADPEKLVPALLPLPDCLSTVTAPNARPPAATNTNDAVTIKRLIRVRMSASLWVKMLGQHTPAVELSVDGSDTTPQRAPRRDATCECLRPAPPGDHLKKMRIARKR